MAEIAIESKIAECKFCSCRILDVASEKVVRVTKEFQIDLPLLNSADAPVSQTLSEFWVADQWTYDNIGVSKPPAPDAPYRFLTCADCDRGPIGLTFPVEEPGQLYLCVDRIKYRGDK